MSPAEPFTPTSRLFADDEMVRAWLRKPFPPKEIGKLPATQKRPALDFVGHAAVTDRLNKIAPDWTYTIDQTFQVGESFWIRGTMTIGGVSRPEYGDGDDPKEAIGNFIRRGAMRFGVAIDLWSREELEASGAPLGTEKPLAKGGAPEDRPSALPPEGTSSVPSALQAGARAPGDDAAPGEVSQGSSPSASSPGDGPKKYRRNPSTQQLEEVS